MSVMPVTCRVRRVDDGCDLHRDLSREERRRCTCGERACVTRRIDTPPVRNRDLVKSSKAQSMPALVEQRDRLIRRLRDLVPAGDSSSCIPPSIGCSPGLMNRKSGSFQK